MNEQLLDTVPIIALPVVFGVAGMFTYEVGFRVGRWYQRRTPGEQEGPTGVLVGSLLALMAFLMAVTMGMAADRFDTRRGLVLAEANAIGTTFLRAGLLPPPVSVETRELLREYVPLRLGSNDPQQLAVALERSTQIHDELWALLEELAPRAPSDEILATYAESLNELIDLHESRVTAGLYARVPEMVVLLLVGGVIFTLAMVGYGAGLTERRSLLSAVALVVALGAVLTVVIDLDRSREGFLQVNQQPLIDVMEDVGPPDG